MNTLTLADLGWSASYLSQLSLDELSALRPARLSAVHRDRVEALSEAGPLSLHLPPDTPMSDMAVGDWVLSDPETDRVTRRLERQSALTRRAAGTGAESQLIAANVDTLFIVSSCNADFSVPRIERYLALAHEAGIQPVNVLTKADLDTEGDTGRAAEKAFSMVPAIPLDGRDPKAAKALADWWRRGQTAVLLGSSGVGKSTLINSLTGATEATADIREDDAKGRHTTTHRALHRARHGGWIIDTPGMRALRLHGVSDGIDSVFDDVTSLAEDCRFGDCTHEPGTPGCAVDLALQDGRLDPDRLHRWQKLRREDARNSETLADARKREKAFGKIVREAGAERKRRGKT